MADENNGSQNGNGNNQHINVRSFRDLEIYKDGMILATELVRDIIPGLEKRGVPLAEKLSHVALIIPTKILQSYGLRFHDRRAASLELFEVTQSCNRLIVYLDQARDIYLDARGAKDRAEKLLEAAFVLRVKVYNLKKSWAQWDEKDRAKYGGNNAGRYQSNSREGNYNNRDYRGNSGSGGGGVIRPNNSQPANRDGPRCPFSAL